MRSCEKNMTSGVNQSNKSKVYTFHSLPTFSGEQAVRTLKVPHTFVSMIAFRKFICYGHRCWRECENAKNISDEEYL